MKKDFESPGENPRNIKLDLAIEICKNYWEELAQEAKTYFERVLKEWINIQMKEI